jgi:hypothetical protein
MGKHHRPDADIEAAADRYERLVRLLYTHRPMARSELCVICGLGWPCVAVWRVLGIRPVENQNKGSSYQ